MGIRMRAKISIAFLSISLIASFGLASNQAFAGEPTTCEECQELKNFCDVTNFFSTIQFDECIQRYMDCSAQLCRAIGGDMIQMETTSVLAAGAQYTAAWMIPVIVSGIGIAIVIARKF